MKIPESKRKKSPEELLRGIKIIIFIYPSSIRISSTINA